MTIPASNSRRKLLIGLTLGLTTLALFLPAVSHQFLGYDDQQYVTENGHVQAGLTWSGVVWAFKNVYASNWHPLTWLSHMLDCQLYGLNSAGHHLTNVLLHAANAVLLFLVLARLTGALWRSAAVAALFAWHPLHVESVAWVAERKDLLCAFFWMLTMWAYGRYVEESGVQSPESRVRNSKFKVQSPESIVKSATEDRKSTVQTYRLGFYLLALTFFALAIMSKPMAVTLPFVLLLLDYWPLQRTQDLRVQRAESSGQSPEWSSRLWLNLFLEKIPFMGLSAAGCVLTIAAQGHGHAIASTWGLPFSERIGHAIISYGHYLWAALAPYGLAVHYPYSRTGAPLQLAAALLVLAGFSLLAVRFAGRRPYLLVGWLWFLGTLVPVIGLVQVGEQAWADRYTYLPLIGIFMAFVWWAGDWVTAPDWKLRNKASDLKTSRRRTLAIGLVALVGIGMAAQTERQLGYWKDTRTLFTHAAAVTERNTLAMAMLGSLEAADGKLDEAKRLYAEGLSYRPDDPETHFCLGKVLAQEGNLDGAIAEYNKALWSVQYRELAHVFIGMALAKEQKYSEAAAHYQAALQVNPESAAAENNLGLLLQREGRFDEAVGHYTAAVKDDPARSEAHNNLGVLLLQRGRLAEGIEQLQEALRLNPTNIEAQCNIAMALNQQEKWQQAADLFATICPKRPGDPNLDYQFSLALYHLNHIGEARSRLAAALLLQQNFPEALDLLAWILATDPHDGLRNGTEAVRMAEYACQMTGRKDPVKLKTLAAAYAESGRFAEAVSTAQAALDLCSGESKEVLREECGRMQDRFRSAQPWRSEMK